MTDIQPSQNIGYSKAFGPGLATAITEILAWILQTFCAIDVPTNIQLDFAMVIGVLLVVAIPHDAIQRMKGNPQ